MLRSFILSYATLPAITRRELDDRVMVDLHGDINMANARNLTAAIEHIATATGFILVNRFPGSGVFAILGRETGLTGLSGAAVLGWLAGMSVFTIVSVVNGAWRVAVCVLAVVRRRVPAALGWWMATLRHTADNGVQRLESSVDAARDLFARCRRWVEEAWRDPLHAAGDLLSFVVAVPRAGGRVLSAMSGVTIVVVLVLGWGMMGVGQG